MTRVMRGVSYVGNEGAVFLDVSRGILCHDFIYLFTFLLLSSSLSLLLLLLLLLLVKD